MTAGIVVRLAGADFRDRVRRPAYLVTLAAAVALAYVAIPGPDAHWTVMNIGDYRGRYDSAYVGTATALAGALWLTLGGFHVVRDAIGRDERTRVGRLLAATPLRTWAYLAAKFLGNVLVLASMVGVLALTAAGMQLLRGEDRRIEPVALLLPFATITLPMVVVTAAMALLFETIPRLRGTLGTAVWFFVSLTAALGGQSGSAPLGGLGVHAAVASMRDELVAQNGELAGQEFSLGLTWRDEPLRTFDWAGFTPGGVFLLQRLALVLLAVAVAVLPALWFARFDPARAGTRAAVGDEPSTQPVRPDTPPVLPRTPARVGFTFPRLLAGELRILVQGVSRRWWVVAASLSAFGLVATGNVVTSAVLPALWIWPLMVWSRLGTQRTEHDLAGLLGAYPTPRRRLFAEWTAGLLLTVLIGLAPAVRMVVAGDTPGLAAWAAGALLIPSFALCTGLAGRTHRLFQALYLPLWWGILNNITGLDFMGAIRRQGEPAGPPWFAVAAVAVVLLAVAMGIGAARRPDRR
ncbi:ABC transporter permease [Embleya sp. NPDC059259]|uniref:ABC transporter permease n=1 Tax=unclassified Embleya TaxID=2699296 RepID=UPI0036A5CEC3